jgi:hypothetical protein
MKIKLYKDAIGFSFWHYYDKHLGTAIQCRRLKPGLFGIRIPRLLSSGEFYGGFQFGLWWTWELSLIAIHPNQFK